MADSPSRRVPPLAWLIVAMLVVVAVIAVSQWRGTYRTPTGRSVPEAGVGAREAVIQPPTVPSHAPPPAPNGAGPTNEPGVQTGPARSGGAS